MSECTEDRFLKDVASHQMSIIRDDGVNRHIRFRRPDSGNLSYDLITWPGYLCYCGDMGTYVFSRIEDMFEFFRSRPGASGLDINTCYWAEKCQAVDLVAGIKKYSPAAFREAVEQYLEDEDISLELRERIEDEVLSCAEDGEQSAREAADRFDGSRFSDFWEADLTEYTFRYVWCCYALVWGIRQYDQHKAQEKGNQSNPTLSALLSQLNVQYECRRCGHIVTG